jgi:hypothetical protein
MHKIENPEQLCWVLLTVRSDICAYNYAPKGFKLPVRDLFGYLRVFIFTALFHIDEFRHSLRVERCKPLYMCLRPVHKMQLDASRRRRL